MTPTAMPDECGQYGLEWSELAKGDRIIRKRKFFRTEIARDHFASLVAEKPSFHRFEARCR